MKPSDRIIKPDSTPFSVYLCAMLVVIVIARVQEIFIFLAPFRPVLVLSGLTILLSIFNHRLIDTDIWRCKETRLAFLFWIIGLITVLFSVWPGGAFKEWRTGLSTNFLLFLCLIANMRDIKNILILNKAVVVAVIILSFSVIISPNMTLNGRQSTTGSYDPNDLALLLVSAAPLALAFFFLGNKRSKIFYGGIFIIILIVLLRTGSRGGFIGMFVLGFIFLFSHKINLSFPKKFLIIAFISILIIYVSPESLWQRFQAVFSGTDYNLQSSEEGSFGRLEIWEYGFKLLIKHPIFGIGAGQFSTAMGQAYGNYFYKTAHNSFLQAAVELGLIGLAIFLSIIIKIFKNLKRVKIANIDSGKADLLTILANFSFFSMTGYLACAFFLSQAYSVIIPFLLANSYVLAKIAEEKRSVNDFSI